MSDTNREILFRGKRVDNGKWVEGFYVVIGGISHYIFTGRIDVTRRIVGCENFKVDPKTIGQFTGLTDKNGNKIFEGDIIAYEDETPGQYEYHDSLFINRGIIRFDDGQFYFTNGIAATMDDLLYRGTLDCEIIGNVHDNPELLKEK